MSSLFVRSQNLFEKTMKDYSKENHQPAKMMMLMATEQSENLSKSIASKIKQQTNCPEQDLKAIRKLLSAERDNQDLEEFQFWTPDFDRMMNDDWLVTRFLLRGSKAADKKFYFINQRKKNEDIYRETMNLIKLCAAFRLEYRINGLTKVGEFPKEWTSKNGLIKHGFDLIGNPVVYLRIKIHKPKLIGTKKLRHQFKRLLLFTLEECDKDLFNKPGKGICCVFDMSDATFENVDLELLTWMMKSFKSCGPKLLSYMIVYNLPWIFNATFKLISSTILSNSNKQSLRFVYGNEISDYISRNNLPMYLKDNLN